MIYLGYEQNEKQAVISDYCDRHGLGHVVVISPKRFPLPVDGADLVDYEQVQMYVTFYRLLQEIGKDTLIVLNEVLRTQNRYDLDYNCIRNFLNQTRHQLVFQQLPQIDTRDDFMILFDFVTQSRWKRRGWDIDLILDNAEVYVKPLAINLERVNVPTSAQTKKKYEAERARRFAKIGARDPHTIPRNLYLIGGADKRDYIDAQSVAQPSLFGGGYTAVQYVARNQRLSRECIVTYAQAERGCYTVVELPHRFIEFSDFIKATHQAHIPVLCADLKVDGWYFDRYKQWQERIHETYASLQQS